MTLRNLGFHKTYERIKCLFFWEDMENYILNFVAECDTFQRNKGEIVKTHGALHPLPIPSSIWTNISMDFIVGLSKEGKQSVIMVVVDRISKYDHFCVL